MGLMIDAICSTIYIPTTIINTGVKCGRLQKKKRFIKKKKKIPVSLNKIIFNSSLFLNWMSDHHLATSYNLFNFMVQSLYHKVKKFIITVFYCR